MNLIYRRSPSVNFNTAPRHPVLTLAQGGQLSIDNLLADLWMDADDAQLYELIESRQYKPWTSNLVRASLACLAESGSLERQNYHPPKTIKKGSPQNVLVSIILVSYNSLEWLKTCLPSIITQDYSPIEVIIVDNASGDGTFEWVRGHHPNIQLYQCMGKVSLAAAINLGITKSSGHFFLLLNPDVQLERNSIIELVEKAQNDKNCAAVAAKLKFTWAPSFLNGLGNYVGAISWGTDCALGHLDLGQFDHWEQVPSACFAAALISASAWKEVGQLDEGFPMYYEDSEWCYRARLLGFSILAAPKAVFFHAFGMPETSNRATEIKPLKLRRIAFGRLRFATLLLSCPTLVRFLISYFLEDLISIVLALVLGRRSHLSAHISAWSDFLKTIKEVRGKRREIQKRRKINDRDLFSIQRKVPPPLIWNKRPLLSTDVIENEYMPAIISGKTRPLPEFFPINANNFDTMKVIHRQFWIKRIYKIWKQEGLAALIHRIGRLMEWHLMQL